MEGSLQRLIQYLSKLPGLGPRSGRRIALHLLKNRERIFEPLLKTLEAIRHEINFCSACGHLDDRNPCAICQDFDRDHTLLCVVADVADVWALERTKSYQGAYHVLGGMLSALEGKGPDDLAIVGLLNRCREGKVQEVILALSSTVEGQTTMHYIADRLEAFPHIRVSTLARGIPLGGELDYLDEGTLTTALSARKAL